MPSDDDRIIPFNQLPEDEQVQEMGKCHPDYPFDKKPDYSKVGRDTVATLVPTKTDADFAAEIKQRIIEAYKPVFEALQEADNRGFGVSSQVAKGFDGKFTFAQLQIVKVY